MFLWVLAVPVTLFAMLLILERLEAFVITPLDRAESVQRILGSVRAPEDVERQVAHLLEPATRWSPFEPAGAGSNGRHRERRSA